MVGIVVIVAVVVVGLGSQHEPETPTVTYIDHPLRYLYLYVHKILFIHSVAAGLQLHSWPNTCTKVRCILKQKRNVRLLWYCIFRSS